MLKIKILLETLKSLPDDYMCYAYEGEVTGLVITDKDENIIGYIKTTESICDSGTLIKD